MRVPRALQSSSPRDMAYGYFFVCFIVNLSLVAGQSVHYALKGGEAILSTTISKPPDDILWKHNGDKVITFDSSVERVFREYAGRVTLAWDTAELTISDVRYEDSGKYELEALIQDKRHYFQIMMKVLDEVAKPTITCEINDESSNKTSGRRATLLCSSESQTPESLTFQWNVDGEVHMGQRLPIALGKEHNELKYFCTAANPLHNETAVFITKDCNTERKLENQTVSLPIIIIIIIIVVLVLIVLCIFLFKYCNKLKMGLVRFKKGKKGGKIDLEEQECDEQNMDESKKPFLETLASKQKLPQQLQSENGNVRHTPQKEGQPDAQDKVHVENPDPDFETDKHKSKDQMVKQETGPKEEEEPLQNNSSPEKSNPVGELDNSSKEQSDQPEQQDIKNDLEKPQKEGIIQKSKRFFNQGGQKKVPPDTQTGSEKKTDEQEEAESLTPTPPPASTLSTSVDIRETKDTDGEHKADQVSVETKGKTDKDSDSSGSKHINEPDKFSEEKTAFLKTPVYDQDQAEGRSSSSTADVDYNEKLLNKRYAHVAQQKNKKQKSHNNEELHSDYNITVYRCRTW